MRGRTTSFATALADGRAASGKQRLPVSPRKPRGPESLVEGGLLHATYRELAQHHVRRFFNNLFAEFTGLHFHIIWKPRLAAPGPARAWPVNLSACCRLCGSPTPRECRICAARQRAPVLGSLGKGHRFLCRFGVRNYWLPIGIRGEILGIASLQALDHPPPNKALPAASHHCSVPPRAMSPSEFIRAARFLRLIIQHVQTATLCDLRRTDLTSVAKALIALEKELARLHELAGRHLPPSPRARRRPRPQSQAEQIVHRLTGRLQLEYPEPVTLQRYAVETGMNPAYLSAVFSQCVGIPFKKYLTDLRLEKAKELLDEPRRTASEVAAAVGYASENRFRAAFKKATGLSPRLWRETMRADPPGSGRSA